MLLRRKVSAMSKRHSISNEMVSKILGRQTTTESYENFDFLNGYHPWQDKMPKGYVAYPVRQLDRGEVLYFNFALAKEMGLIAQNHPNQLNQKLIEKILHTFAIQIINEYDQLHGKPIAKEKIKDRKFMATRYLQLQHANKQGKTSGDGRSVWNGIFQHEGKTWDISSRGTGVTVLSPGSVEANRPLKSGEGEFGYGCGMADVDELYGSAIMSEIFHRNGIPTERTLTVIDLGNGLGIGVRAALNLLRPAHLFLYLKQNRWDELKTATDFLLERQIANRRWSISINSRKKYDLLLTTLAKDFAYFAAQLERHYVFAWLEWDGDNLLADPGIIDYGSIRQFGLRHDQYRYDDIQRFSTTLNEQADKAKLTVQIFAQLVDFLKTKKRKDLKEFRSHSSIKLFDSEFKKNLRLIFLKQVGFSEEQANYLYEKNRQATEKLFTSFGRLERTKTKNRLKRVADGVNRPAVFNMRNVLREFPAALLSRQLDSSTHNQKNHFAKFESSCVSNETLISWMRSNFAKKHDLRLSRNLKTKIELFKKDYCKLLSLASKRTSRRPFLEQLSANSNKMNFAGRITGNGAEFIVDEVLKAKKKGMKNEDLQTAVELFVTHQTPTSTPMVNKPIDLQSSIGRLFQNLVNIAIEYQEEI